MATKLEEALSVATQIQENNGQYAFPPKVPLGKLAESTRIICVALERYRKLGLQIQCNFSDIESNTVRGVKNGA